MKRMLWVVVVAIVFLLLGSACPTIYAQEKVVKLNFSNMFSPGNRFSIYMEQWGKEIEKRTKGGVKVTVFPTNTLTPFAQTYAGVIKGVADVGMSVCAYTTGRFPLTEVIDLPLGYKTGYVATRLTNEYYKKFKPKEFDDVKICFLHGCPPHKLFSKRPINNLEDLKGLKVRSSGTGAVVIQALGGAPVAMPMTDSYDALSKGITQAIITAYEPIKEYKIAELVKYSIEFERGYSQAFFVAMNKDKWNAFPTDIQKIIDEINEEWIEKIARLWDDIERESKEFFLQSGGKVTMLSKEEHIRWTDRLLPMLDDYVKQKKSMGLPADEALKFCIDYLKAHQN